MVFIVLHTKRPYSSAEDMGLGSSCFFSYGKYKMAFLLFLSLTGILKYVILINFSDSFVLLLVLLHTYSQHISYRLSKILR